jgi:hypothetical protein
MIEALEALEAFGPARLLRGSFFAYPLLNALHILSIGMLVTTAIVMDLRVLGVGRTVTVETAIRALRPVAIAALIFAVLSGFTLFSVQPLDYAFNPAFQVKLVLLAIALVNALAFTTFRAHRRPESGSVRVMAILSITLWVSVVVAGRMIGFLT